VFLDFYSLAYLSLTIILWIDFTLAAQVPPRPRTFCFFQAASGSLATECQKWQQRQKSQAKRNCNVLATTQRSDRPRSIWLPRCLTLTSRRLANQAKSNCHGCKFGTLTGLESRETCYGDANGQWLGSLVLSQYIYICSPATRQVPRQYLLSCFGRYTWYTAKGPVSWTKLYDLPLTPSW
jgi:hypothetical protein